MTHFLLPLQYSIGCVLAILLALPQTMALGQVDISGTLLGADGRPLTMAHMIVRNGRGDTTVVVPVDATGQFAFTLSEPGGYGVYATGVHHETLTMPLILTKNEEVALHIRLSTYQSLATEDSFYVVVASSEDDVPMQERPDGTYEARLEASADTLAYRIRYGAKASEWSSDRVTAGTSQDRLVFDESGPFWDREGDYSSVLDLRGEPFVDIVLDPSALPQHAAESSVSSVPPVIGDIAAAYLDVEQKERQLGQAVNGNVIQYLWTAWRIRGTMKKSIGRERNPLLRQWLILRYFDELHPRSSKYNRYLAHEVFESVPTDSPFWSFEAWSNVGASNLISQISRQFKHQDIVGTYVRQVIDDHPDPNVRAQFLYYGVYAADNQEDDKTKWLYYSMLQDSHADTRQAERARRDFDPEKSLQTGNPIPQFSFISFDNSTVTITDRSLRGQTYLLDFWGTWCAPCIEEIPALEKTYDRYQESGFEILSVAFLDEHADIEQFRRDRYPMPWLHTRVTRKDDASVRQLFEITSFPRPILVNEQGVIIAIDDELRDGLVWNVVRAKFDGAE